MRVEKLLMSINNCLITKPMKIPVAKCPPDAKVTIWGVSPLTKAILLDLKMSPLLDEIRIYDKRDKAVKLANDLNQIPTNSVVRPFYGGYQLGACLKDVDVIVLAGGYYGLPGEKIKTIFSKNLPSLLDVAYECAHNNPSAAVIVLTPPGTRNVPMISELYEKIGIEDPGKIMAPMYQYKMLASKLISELFSLPKNVVSLPIVGGCCSDSVIPVFSHATPLNEFTKRGMKEVLQQLRKAYEKVVIKQRGKPVLFPIAMATSKLILDIVNGYFGIDQHPEPVFSRSDVLMNVQYLGTPLQFGVGGVKKNASMPQLSNFEMKLLSKVVVGLQKDARIGKAAALSKWNELDL